METLHVQQILINLFNNIHWLPVIVLTLFSFLLGALWHSPLLFGKFWKEKNNYTVDKKDLNFPLIFGVTAVGNFIALTGLNAFIANQGVVAGAIGGLMVAGLWIVPAMTATYLFANRSLRLAAIDAGMYVVLFTIAGAVFGVW